MPKMMVSKKVPKVVIASPGPAMAGYIRYEQLSVIASKPQRALPAVINERNFFIHNVSW
jgi:hypothetical protein